VESSGKGPGTKVAPDRHTPARPLPCHTGAQFEHAETVSGCHGVPLARLIVITGLAGGRPHAGTEAGSRCSGPSGAACRTRQVDWPSPDDGHDQGGQLAEVIPDAELRPLAEADNGGDLRPSPGRRAFRARHAHN
jgi:hypothetical protein